jgi:hypothetical protein
MKKIVLFITLIFLIIFITTVQSGCRNDMQLPDVPCDTAHTFKLAIMPILNTNCRVSGCHIGNNAPNGVLFDTYAQVKAQLVLVNNIPKLLGVIRHDAGFDPMPQGRPKLDNCSITKIKLWIDAGAQDN